MTKVHITFLLMVSCGSLSIAMDKPCNGLAFAYIQRADGLIEDLDIDESLVGRAYLEPGDTVFAFQDFYGTCPGSGIMTFNGDTVPAPLNMVKLVDAGVYSITAHPTYQEYHEDANFVIAAGVSTNVQVKAMLDGPYDEGIGMMRDDRRVLGLIESSVIGGGFVPEGTYTHLSLPVALAQFQVTGQNAIVDWVRLEWRPVSDPGQVTLAKAYWIQRDGNLMEVDGDTTLKIILPPGFYHLAIRHKGHLGGMTALPLEMTGGSNQIDLTDTGVPLYGTDAMRERVGVRTLWAGNAKVVYALIQKIAYAGAGNDRDYLLAISGGQPTANMVSPNGTGDLNMDGYLKYTGAGNDRDIILQSLPDPSNITSVRIEQLPY